MSEPDRTAARAMAAQAREDGRPLAWFEQLYAAAADGSAVVPWADLEVNPHLASWTGLSSVAAGARVLVVGCGYGDDAEWLVSRGFDVTAFDISPTAVAHCRARFPDTAVHYETCDLLQPFRGWLAQPFDLVVEAYTIQVLPPGSPERAQAIRVLGELTGKQLLIIARGREDSDPTDQMPWPITRSELWHLEAEGLTVTSFEDYLEGDVRRFRITYARTV